MCERCGCDGIEHEHAHAHAHEHVHAHAHAHEDEHEHEHVHEDEHDRGSRTIRLEEDILRKNAHIAAHNRSFFAAREVVAINVMSSPGSGKTTLLERLVADRKDARSVVVIQGDQATDRDAERIRRAGARAVQINTGTGCHLDASMVARALRELDPSRGALVMIENVGNLVCPALFDLGENARLVVASTPEGADKPLKYPYLFRGADAVVLNKIDLAPYVDFDAGAFDAALAEVAPRAVRLRVSATRGLGLGELYAWIDRQGARAEAS